MSRGLSRVLGVAVSLAVLLGVSQNSWALTSAEGTVIGDQGFYWTTPAETWIFPHRLGNIDNRVFFQIQSGAALNLQNVEPNQLGNGGGFVLELIDNMNLGLWLSAYNPGHGGWVDAAVGSLGWNNFVGDGVGGETAGLQGVDAYAPGFEAGRKLDLFTSFWLPELDIETGLHLWWGSAGHKFTPDNSNGPIDIDKDSDPTTGDPLGVDNADDKLAIKESVYGLSDFGIGLGAGYRGMEGFRADLGLDFNMLGVKWQPNGISDYVDAGGKAFGINLRSHIDLSDQWTVGGFARFKMSSFSLEPKRQRDGGELFKMYKPTDADEQSSLPDPSPLALPGIDPTLTSNEHQPVAGIKYEQGGNVFQVAGLVRYRPHQRATFYSALGFGRWSSNTKISVGDDWYAQMGHSSMALPFIHVGFEGKVFEHLDLFLGGTKRWAGLTTKTTFYDSRIPNNDDAQGPVGTAPAPGQENNTNKNRREIENVDKVDDATTSNTNLMLGTRIHYGAVQLVGHLNPTVLLSGTYLLSGTPANPWLWVSLVYDWDYDSDTEYGNGSMKFAGSPSPHEAAPAVEASPSPDSGVRQRAQDADQKLDSESAPAPAPAPAPAGEEFDS